jgi:hypothetical protein
VYVYAPRQKAPREPATTRFLASGDMLRDAGALA